MSLFRKTYPVGEVLESSRKELVEALPDQLISLVHFGTHVDSSLTPDPNDEIQLLVVVEETNKKTLDQLAEAYGRIKGRNQIAPMVLTLSELKSSTDVFPTIFLEMIHHYELLAGEDALNQLEIETPYLRIRCEQALKNLLFRLQSSYMTQRQGSKYIETLIHTTFQNLIKILHSVRVLYGESFSQSRKDVIAWAANQLQLDLELLQLLDQNDSRNSNSRDRLLEHLAGLIRIVSDAAAAVNQIPDTVELVESVDS